MKIYIEGNIACGKSTFTRLLKNHFQSSNYSFIQEPVDEWISIKDNYGKNILEHFYKDSKKWAFPFQMTTFITRTQKITSVPKNTPTFIERSVFTDKNCFATNLYENGLLNDIEWKLYKDWFDWLTTHFDVEPNYYIYLKTTPETCYERLKKRSRSEETNVSLHYLQQLHEKHNQWLYEHHNKYQNVLFIDANIEFENNPERFCEIVEEIEKQIL
tara:strand:+ start:571 stop:1215 length:645 start_codon:yes stop_codon:yes gene_type:complete